MARHMHFCGQPNFSQGKYVPNITCQCPLAQFALKSVGLSAVTNKEGGGWTFYVYAKVYPSST